MRRINPPPSGEQSKGPFHHPPHPPFPPPPPMPYPAPPPAYYAPPPAQTNWWAIVSLIFGILGGVLISVICGIVGLNKAKQGPGGRGLAIAGLVLSGIWVLGLAAGIVF